MFEKLAYDIQIKANEKLANRARELQRMGRLSADAISTLLDKKMLPDTRTVIRGMNRGSRNIMEKLRLVDAYNITPEKKREQIEWLLERGGMTPAHSKYTPIIEEVLKEWEDSLKNKGSFFSPINTKDGVAGVIHNPPNFKRTSRILANDLSKNYVSPVISGTSGYSIKK